MQTCKDFSYKTKGAAVLLLLTCVSLPLVLVLSNISVDDAHNSEMFHIEANHSEMFHIEANHSEMFHIEANHIPLALGLVFHDAMDGLDGCININAPENRNIVELVDTLDEKYPNLTRVDKWVLAGNNAVRAVLTDTTEQERLVYATGRIQSRECNTTSNLDSEASWPHFVTKFRMYGMTEAEMVALMAVHGMFGAHKNVSGYSGQWVIDPPSVVTSEYYRYLRDFTYRKTVERNRTQFRRVTDDGLNTDYLMLSSEITMYYASVNDIVSPNCPKNALFATYVEEFARDSHSLETAFVTAWNKMTRVLDVRDPTQLPTP